MLRQNRYYQAVAVTGMYAAIATCFFIPLSTSLMDFFSFITFSCWVLSGKFFEFPQLMKRSPVACFSILLFLLFVIGVFYSSSGIPYSLEYLYKYSVLIYLPAVISILDDNQKAKLNAEYSFVIGSIVLLTISYLIHFSLLTISMYDDPHLFHITKDFFITILAFWSAHYLFDSKQYRYLWLLVLVAAICDTILISPDETGIFIFIILMLLFLFQRLSLKKLTIALLFICSLFIGSFFVSNTFSVRVNKVLNEIITYQYGKSATVIGQKLDRWNEYLKLIRHKPLFGYGTGGKSTVTNQLLKERETQPTTNPQNEYLLISYQLGMLGLLLFLALFISQWISAKKFPDKDKYLIQGIVLSMVSGCVMNSFLCASHQGHFFAFLSGIFFAITPRCPLDFQKSAALAGFYTG